MNVFAARLWASPHENRPSSEREHSDIGTVVLLITTLVFAPIIALHAACLTHPADTTKPVAASAADGSDRAPPIPTHG
jgi:hypothetical protein